MAVQLPWFLYRNTQLFCLNLFTLPSRAFTTPETRYKAVIGSHIKNHLITRSCYNEFIFCTQIKFHIHFLTVPYIICVIIVSFKIVSSVVPPSANTHKRALRLALNFLLCSTLLTCSSALLMSLENSQHREQKNA